MGFFSSGRSAASSGERAYPQPRNNNDSYNNTSRTRRPNNEEYDDDDDDDDEDEDEDEDEYDSGDEDARSDDSDRNANVPSGGGGVRRSEWDHSHDNDGVRGPGSVEYLESLLRGTRCPHSNAPRASDRPDVPDRLGFFSENSSRNDGVMDPTYFIDTKNLCENCYNKAVPNGFIVWSTSYWDDYDAAQEKKLGRNYKPRTPYPPTLQAGSRTDYWETYNGPMAPHTPRFPGALIVHDCWRYLVYVHSPFYIDQLHVNEPYNPNCATKREQNAQDVRIALADKKAYLGARYGVIATPVGGRSEWTMFEQRELGERIVRLPRDFGNPNTLQEMGDAYLVPGDDYIPSYKFSFGGKLTGTFDFGNLVQRMGSQKDDNVKDVIASDVELDALAKQSHQNRLPRTRAEQARRNERLKDDQNPGRAEARLAAWTNHYHDVRKFMRFQL